MDESYMMVVCGQSNVDSVRNERGGRKQDTWFESHLIFISFYCYMINLARFIHTQGYHAEKSRSSVVNSSLPAS